MRKILHAVRKSLFLYKTLVIPETKFTVSSWSIFLSVHVPVFEILKRELLPYVIFHKAMFQEISNTVCLGMRLIAYTDWLLCLVWEEKK